VIVADTHTWLWWTDDPGRLSEAARTAIEVADRVLVSAISCLELSTLVRRGRIAVDRPVEAWIAQALGGERFEAVPVTPRIASAAGLLPDAFPGDPADRIIYATALSVGARLVTRDDAIHACDARSTVW